MNNNLVSSCCGAEPVSNGDSDLLDMGLCPACGDRCEYVEYDLPENWEPAYDSIQPTAEDFLNWQKLK